MERKRSRSLSNQSRAPEPPLKGPSPYSVKLRAESTRITPTAGLRSFMTAAARRFSSKTWKGFGIKQDRRLRGPHPRLGAGLRRGAPTVDVGLAQHFRHLTHSGYIRLLYCKQRLLSVYCIRTNFFRPISFSFLRMSYYASLGLVLGR
jgi:hypothetical protein